MNQIRKLLVANRGEIACRVMRTCRDMGIDTVAVFSDADADAAHVRQADEAVRIGPAPAAESYLDIERILTAAALTGADAIHPGYGFLAENAAFAAACGERGLTFVGPSPEVIRTLGSKQAAKALVAAAGVPVVPGSVIASDADAQTPAALTASVRAIGLPVLIKASAGGGGRGMRIIPASAGDDGDDKLTEHIVAAVESAKREAKAAFGDDSLLLERYLERPRHIELQILGDRHGTIIHLLERECSIQRRYQKIIEEAPALDDDLRARMGAAAVAVGRAIGYENAGTVEFILAPDGAFYFLEVNTRLQVEHPVTECITGLDLVREQIRVARGERIDHLAAGATSGNDDSNSSDRNDGGDDKHPNPAPLVPRGAAIECRLYAEDPDNQFLPTSGQITDWHLPHHPGIRVDSSVDANAGAGQQVSIHYDPMLAKIICHAPTRAEAIARLSRYLREMSVQGVVTNRELLLRVLAHREYRDGNIDTHFLERHRDELFGHAGELPPSGEVRRAAITAALFGHETRRAERPLLPGLEPGFRNVPSADQEVCYHVERAAGVRLADSDSELRQLRVQYRNLGQRRFQLRVTHGAGDQPASDGPAARDDAAAETVALVAWQPPTLTWEDSHGVRRHYRVIESPAASPGLIWVHNLACDVALREAPRFPEHSADDIAGSLGAPMPGTVVRVLVSPGQHVAAGEALVVIEAMKMEHTLTATEAGVIAQVLAAEGEAVESGQVVVVVEPAAEPA
ncbi:MAG: biotin carboxylase N-terminal domain-containing protein [Haliangiales bacterium]